MKSEPYFRLLKKFHFAILISLFIAIAFSCNNAKEPISKNDGIQLKGIVKKGKKLAAVEGYFWKKDHLTILGRDSIPVFVLVNKLKPDDVLAFHLCGCGGWPLGPNTCEAISAESEVWCFGDCSPHVSAPNCGDWILWRMPFD